MRINTRSIITVLVILVLVPLSTGNISPGITNTASTLTTNDLEVTNLKNITYQPSFILWTWTNPDFMSYSKISVYINGNFKANLQRGQSFYLESGTLPNTNYTISTKVIDNRNVPSNYWVNQTSRTSPNYMSMIVPPPVPQQRYSIKYVQVLGTTISYCRYDPNGIYTSLKECTYNK